MNGRDLVKALKKKFDVRTDKDIAGKTGLSASQISALLNKETVTPAQIANMVAAAKISGKKDVFASAVCPIVEFYPIECCESRQGKSYELFKSKDGSVERKYQTGLKKELVTHYGVYIFFDSAGKAIYAGKAREQSLWKEMNLAFNRARGAAQKIKRVKHPSRNQPYRTSEEVLRQIRPEEVPLYELAAYFSAYAVERELINAIEALLVRSFANNLLNVRMEKAVCGTR